MRPNVSAAAVSAALQFVRAFSATVVYRQVPAAYQAMLWHASPPGGRWNPTFPALYAALDLDVALAERIKRGAGAYRAHRWPLAGAVCTRVGSPVT